MERTLEYGAIHQQPLEGWTSRSWKPPKQVAFAQGVKIGGGVGEVPLAREENIFFANINPFSCRDLPA